ncbi:MAG: transporter substrate-binding domain-containing protein [Desulfotignum sp.]
MKKKSAGYALVLSLLLFLLSQDSAMSKQDMALSLNVHITESYHDDLSGLLQKKYIRVLTTVNRTNFYISDGQLVGYEYALIKGYEDFLNQQVDDQELRVVLEFITVSRDQLIPKLVQGYGDIAAAGLTITPQRKNKIRFTTPYLTNINEVVVTRKGKFLPVSVFDLSGKKVHVRQSSSYHESLVKLNTKLRKINKKPVAIIALDEEIETEVVLEMVDSGAIGITVADSHIAMAWANVLTNIAVHEALVLRENSKIAWGVRKNNPQLLSSLNAFLKTHRKGTLLGNIYFNRYYESNNRLKNPLETEEWEKINRYKKVIKKYAREYGFDWLLILAIAFQESELNHSQKSSAGAVGLLQVLPSTAQDEHIGIKNVHILENNVHAGVKYLAFLRDRYFTSEKIPVRDQIRFSLAAYNAGPATIRKAREMAGEMGLNRTKWFRNVELAALRIVGQETVRYVSNINKYYVLYQSILAD